MYRAGPSDEELALVGMKREDVGQEPDIEVWEENWKALHVFMSLSTQWNYTMGSPTGLNYGSVWPVMECMEVEEVDKAGTFIRLMIMEREALRIMHEQSKSS